MPIADYPKYNQWCLNTIHQWDTEVKDDEINKKKTKTKMNNEFYTFL